MPTGFHLVSPAHSTVCIVESRALMFRSLPSIHSRICKQEIRKGWDSQVLPVYQDSEDLPCFSRTERAPTSSWNIPPPPSLPFRCTRLFKPVHGLQSTPLWFELLSLWLPTANYTLLTYELHEVTPGPPLFHQLNKPPCMQANVARGCSSVVPWVWLPPQGGKMSPTLPKVCHLCHTLLILYVHLFLWLHGAVYGKALFLIAAAQEPNTGILKGLLRDPFSQLCKLTTFTVW